MQLLKVYKNFGYGLADSGKFAVPFPEVKLFSRNNSRKSEKKLSSFRSQKSQKLRQVSEKREPFTESLCGNSQQFPYTFLSPLFQFDVTFLVRFCSVKIVCSFFNFKIEQNDLLFGKQNWGLNVCESERGRKRKLRHCFKWRHSLLGNFSSLILFTHPDCFNNISRAFFYGFWFFFSTVLFFIILLKICILFALFPYLPISSFHSRFFL